MYRCQSQSPNSSHSPPLSPLVSIHLFSTSVSLFLLWNDTIFWTFIHLSVFSARIWAPWSLGLRLTSSVAKNSAQHVIGAPQMNGRKLWRWREDGPGSREEPLQGGGGKARWRPSEAQPESSHLAPSAPAFKTLSQLVPTHWASRESWVGHCICKRMMALQHHHQETIMMGFPGGTVIRSLPANAGDTGLSPGLGRSHMPRSN